MRGIEDTSAFGLPMPQQLLDPDAVLDRLRSGPLLEGLEVRAVRPRYLRLKPSTSLLVLYDVDVIDAEGAAQVVPVHGIQGDGELARREERKWQMLHPNLGNSCKFVQIDRDRDVVLARFPYDLGLRLLPWATEPKRIKRLHEELGYVLTDGEKIPARARGTEATVLSYRPRRRCVLRWVVRTRPDDVTVYRRAVVRVLDTAPDASIRWRQDSCPDFVPRLLGTGKNGCILVEEDLEADAVTERMRLAPTQELGHLIGRFHRWTSTMVAPRKSSDPADFVQRWMLEAGSSLEHLSILQTTLRSEVAALQRRLPEFALPDPKAVHWTGIHGDLHLAQILHRGGDWKIVDLDRAGPGPAEADLGTLFAHLLLEGREEVSTFESLCSGYQEAFTEGTDGASVRTFAALALLRSSVDLTRRFEAQALSRTRRRLSLAQDLFERVATD